MGREDGLVEGRGWFVEGGINDDDGLLKDGGLVGAVEKGVMMVEDVVVS